jgi:cell division septum initiation protein DivIVA
MPPIKVATDILAAALEGFQVQKERLDARISEIRQMLGGGSTKATTPSETGKPKRKVSAAARRRMAQAQKLRWKKTKQGSEPSQPEKPKRTMSAAARKRIAAAQRKRWAEKKKKAESKTA